MEIQEVTTEQVVTQQVKKFRKELSSGTMALVLLSTLAKAKEPLYGYQIAKLLSHTGSEKQGALYPVLRNLSTKGLLESKVEPSESGPPRKYFIISKLGRKVLTEWLQIWEQTQSFVNEVTSDNPSGDSNE
ncbi:MAG: PadR family transcriptional regulator [Gammaproteobacteria bacterium]|nr:PadR family transcriptional regulator [Gammaproteobacteria bacterium]